MADSKITALTALTAADPVNDMFPVVDVSDTSMAASGTTKKISVNNILGASGTATLASATITGAATVGTTLGVTGVSTLTGNAFANGSATVSGGTPGAFANAALTINNRGGVSDLSLIALGYRPNGTILNGAAYIGFITTSGSGNVLGDLIFGTRSVTTDTAPLERYRIDSTGISTWSVGGSTAMTLNSTGLNIANGNVILGTSGKGIDFSATSNSSGTMTSELLNDYEEGTWTPVVADASTGGNVGTCTINTATYTKIGRQVSIQCDLRSITTTGMTGGNKLFIRGLPFASVKGGNGNFYTYRVGRNASTVSSEVSVEQGVSYAFLSLFTASSANTNLSILVSDIVSGTSELALSVTYTV